jgi:hypothetical protein
MDITQYLNLVAFLGTFLILYIVKPLLPEKAVKFIPVMAAICGVIFVSLIKGNFDVMIFIEGLISGLAATGLKEIIKGIKEALATTDTTDTTTPTKTA